MEYIIMESNKDTGEAIRFILVGRHALRGETPEERLEEILSLTSARHKEKELCFNGLLTKRGLERRFPDVARLVVTNSDQIAALKVELSKYDWSWPEGQNNLGVRNQFSKTKDDLDFFGAGASHPPEFSWKRDLYLYERIQMQAMQAIRLARFCR